MEEWKSYPNLSKYEFSNFGRFRNTNSGFILKQSVDNSCGGYVVTLFKFDNEIKRRKIRVHRIIGELFVENPDPLTKKEINHKDGDKTNNHYTNLEWVTTQENITHSIKTGLRTRSWAQKLTENEVRNIRQEYENSNMSFNMLADKYNVSSSSIVSLLKFKSYADIEPHKKYNYKINQKSDVRDTNFNYDRFDLTEDDIREIRRLFDETAINLNMLKKQFNIKDKHSVKDIIKYRSWKHVDSHKKFEYNINKLKGNELLDFYRKKVNCQNVQRVSF